jgi:hypothetical protein
MSRGQPLALTTQQLNLIKDAARQLQVDLRARYLCAVADELLGREIDNDSVAQAVTSALQRFMPPSAA